MKLIKLILKNYKSHKEFEATFDGLNKLVQGNKGSGKTSLKDAYTWILTGAMVDDPTPVDDMGVIIDNLVISVEAHFDNDVKLRIESKQKWTKGVLTSNHQATYFINDTPYTKTQYLAYLDEVANLEQRKILLDPSWFAHGNGLMTTGATSKTAIQRRREIVISVAGAEDTEKSIAQNELAAKQAKYALGIIKGELSDAYAGVETLNNSLIDVSHLDKELLQESIANLEKEKASANQSIESLSSGNEVQNTLKHNLNVAQEALSKARVVYTLEYDQRLSVSRVPYQSYLSEKSALELQYQQALSSEKSNQDRRNRLLVELTDKDNQRNNLLKEYETEKNNVYIVGSVTCQTCGQGLPSDMLLSAEAKFNKHKSDKLETIVSRGSSIKSDIDALNKTIDSIVLDFGSKQINEKINELVQPVLEEIPTFEETPEYAKLYKAVEDAHAALNSDTPNDNAKQIYVNAIAGFNESIRIAQGELQLFATNDHIHESIAKVQAKLLELSDKKDIQEEILDKCNEFNRTTLKSLETKLEQVFPDIRFKMFEYTLDGEAKDTCITYAKTAVGYIPWSSLSGGQKRTATIALANAFTRAWGVQLPLWVDDTQIYVEDETNAIMQLIRITEVPNARLEVK